MKANIIAPEAVDWARLDAFADRTVFQTRDWLHFVRETQRGEIVVCALADGGETVGYFTGLVVSRLGIRILGSSFPGWTTPYMGFNLVPGASRKVALAAIERTAWDTLKCLHMEVSDPFFSVDDGNDSGFTCESYASYRSDLTETEDKLFSKMDSACRRCVRKAEKSGVTIEEAHDLNFADDYYEQLKDVFLKQGLVPTYTVERVRALVRNLEPTGRILLVRARDPEGKCIATGIFPGFNKIAEFWGNASFRSSQHLRPNEAVHWYALRYWKSRGAEIYDWGGEGTYKEKYGCLPHRVPWFTKSRFKLIAKLRGQAKAMFERKQRLEGWLQSRRKPPGSKEGGLAEP
jgi:GNAT acetyltransferase-like protein